MLRQGEDEGSEAHPCQKLIGGAVEGAMDM